jgi:serine/threonine-protein kinase RsbW
MMPIEPLHLRIRSDPAEIAPVRRAIEQWMERAGFEGSCADHGGLCVNEAIANVMRHAYHNRTDGRIEVECRLDAGEVLIRIRDWGDGRLPPDPTGRQPDPLKPGGLGLVCLARMMDSIRFIPQADGMVLEMRKRPTVRDQSNP